MGCPICNYRIKPVETIIGHCKNCNKIYCIKHRLPESHKCIQNSDVK